MNRIRPGIALLLWLAPLPLCAQTDVTETRPADAPAVIEPEAVDVLKRMSAHLAAARSFSLETESHYDVIEPDETRVQLSRKAKIKVRRPAGLHVRARGDDGDREIWYDGRRVTILDRKMKVYSEVDAPDTNDAMFDHMAEKYGLTVPVADLLYADPYETLIAGARRGHVVGQHRVGRRTCHHLAFEQDDLDWQIWIEVGPQPLPRKLVVTHKAQPGLPQYQVLLDDWDLTEDFDQGEFEFRPSSSLEKIEMRPLDDDGEDRQTPQRGDSPAPSP